MHRTPAESIPPATAPAAPPAPLQGNEWEEKWGEKYWSAGKAEKFAEKWAREGGDVWHEKWGENYDGEGGWWAGRPLGWRCGGWQPACLPACPPAPSVPCWLPQARRQVGCPTDRQLLLQPVLHVLPVLPAGGCLKYTDKWAERDVGLGGKDEWGDKWEETFKNGSGNKKVGMGRGWAAGQWGGRFCGLV